MTRTSPPLMDYLNSLPPELWLACWTCCSRHQLRRIALVCKLFRSLCLPLLFSHQSFGGATLRWERTITFDETNWIDHVRYLHRTAVRLGRVAEDPRVLLVHSLKFVAKADMAVVHNSYIVNLHLFDTTYARAFTTFFATLGRYQNLSSLHLTNLTIDTALRATLSSFPLLSDLVLDSCNITAHDGALLKLVSFNVVEAGRLLRLGAGTTRRLISPQHIQSLRIQDVETNLAWISGFGAAQFPNLVALSLRADFDIEVMFTFLKQCPNLKSLAVNSVATNQAAFPQSLPPDTIPHLREITAPMALVRLLTPNRPVSAVTVIDEPGLLPSLRGQTEDIVPALMAIAQASVPLRSLVIRRGYSTITSLSIIASLFPELQDLIINVMSESPAIDSRCPELHDEDAFTDLPVDELSDAEDDDPPLVVRITEEWRPVDPAAELHKIFNAICDGSLALPAPLEVLRLTVEHRVAPFSLNEQHQMLARLRRLYPGIREVEMGGESDRWERTGAVWKRCGAEEYMQV
ncbi:hypothetical protein B0H11DRAFT_2066508 [Mycena galericulata]|nr:hypothetical protein B0H11DRAFT_2133367 [Mycena galericulata]KAJ7455987.1 hypothetical protein B0H11DRAFT_2066508 [Mycena galericulata]